MFVFTRQAQKQLLKLEIRIQNQIKQKLLIFKTNKLLFNRNVKHIANMYPITHRIRIGGYRLLLWFDADKEIYIVLKVAHRKEVYK